MTGQATAIIIPAFNEAATIFQVAEQAGKHGRVFVLDDASSDATGKLAAKAGAVVLRNPRNLGYDATLAKGLQAALADGARYLITIDADGQHDPALLPLALAKLQGGAELVLGQRDCLGRWSEHVFNLYARLRFGVADLLCGFKGYSAALAAKAGPEPLIQSIGTGIAVYGLKLGLKPALLPVAVRPRQDAPRFGAGLKANFIILKALCKAWELTP